MGIRQEVRHSALTAAFVGSNPTCPWDCREEEIHINIKVSGKIEKTVEVNPADVIVSLEEKWGLGGYFVKDGKVYEPKQCSLYGDYENVLAPDCIQDKANLISAIGVLLDELR